MKVGAPKEVYLGERRVAITPSSAVQMQKLGHECIIETGAGLAAGFSDEAYKEAGVKVLKSAAALWKASDIVIKVRDPIKAEQKFFRDNQTLISFLNPADNEELLKLAAKKGTNVIAMEMVPRISRAQKMDALSSMANIAGYRAIIEAGNNFGRFFTGQITAAGKIPPAKVLVVGAGVAGLAAIGTATSLGAIVRAFDVRPEVAEQIESLGAEFLFLDFDDNQGGAETGGYASPSSPEFRKKQLSLFLKQASDIDIVITTALIPNHEAPELWTKEMVERMKPGSVIIDLAAEKGGNCKLTVPDERIVTENGVIIVGYTDFPSRMANQASTLYSTNIRHMIADLTPNKDGIIIHDMEDDVLRGATVTYNKKITYPPPAPKIAAIASPKTNKSTKPLSRAEEKSLSDKAFKTATKLQIGLLCVGGLLMLGVGSVAPESFMQHFIVFVLACFIGFQVIWKVSHALHTPLMAVTNAISGIVILGALLQVGSSNFLVLLLSTISILIASINIVGGFLVTRRMLAMFQKS
ncbi:MAG: Re/Si-specific NAD(P)(+) transhydrogenase subunit alpha [Paracoccaceae bacterium]|nr:Re/Si-specific NAD(P)(+) transhydrogenase subunit alpha [Paracoccaceae bacterium]